VHEPDVLWFDRPNEWYGKIKNFGFFRMTFGKFMARYSLRILNINRRSGKMEDLQIIEYLRHLRLKVLNNLKTAIFAEANAQYRGIIDLLSLAFPDSKTVYIIRDPRFWINSWINMTIPLYSRLDISSWFKSTRLTPFHIKDDPYQVKWKTMTHFEKLCWVWARENSYALECARKTDAAKVFRYEDLFGEQTRDDTFTQMLKFMTRFPSGFVAKWTYKPELLRQKVHSTSERKFPKWTEWSSEKAKLLDRHGRVLMDQFDYGKEPEWLEKIGRI
jgi:hypothetical protein